MCGITGFYALNEQGKLYSNSVSLSLSTLNKRGPDDSSTFYNKNVGFGHARLAIIDTSLAASQPFTDKTGRYTIIYNGEIFNFQALRKELEKKSISFFTSSDTEVLLQLYINEGAGCLDRLNGFFAFAIYDMETEELFIARDRAGKKPLLYSHNDNAFLFASEMKALLAYGIEKDLDHESIITYLQLNYIPGPHSIFKQVKKLLPGHYLTIKDNKIAITKYYEVSIAVDNSLTYEIAKANLISLLDASVRRRLVSDVPLGAFLSGGIDSSVVVALASKYKQGLHTFSIGYKDEPYFDETHYANLVAKKFGTKHTVFALTNNDLLRNLNDALDYLDEPFGDSSALAVHILSMYTRNHVTVALSGDGADEMFAGYHKHLAHYKALQRSLPNMAIRSLSPALRYLPKSRNNKLSNTIRQMHRYGEGLKLDPKERYWRWCSFASEHDAQQLLNADFNYSVYNERKNSFLQHIDSDNGLNGVLLADMNLVLVNDMLTKVDMMAMANSLEVRSPFLDYTIMDFAFSIPDSFKINNGMKKRIVQDAFKTVLPDELYLRPKKGFEVPLLAWLRGELSPMIAELLLNDSFIKEQNIFEKNEIAKLYKQLHSNNPGESPSRIWGLLVFQHWYKRYMYGKT